MLTIRGRRASSAGTGLSNRRGTCPGTLRPAPVSEERSQRRWAAPRMRRRGRSPRPAQRNGYAGDGTHAHNTLSAESTHVRVFYPFHPLRGTTLQILRRPKRGDGAVSVIDPTGRRLKIPVWMLSPDCGGIEVTQEPHLSKESLLALVSLASSLLDPQRHIHGNLPQTAVAGCEGGCRDAATVAGPADRERKRSGATGRSGTRRSDRSHGPRSGGDLSGGGRKS